MARMRERTSVYRGWVGESECRRPLGRPKHRWEDSIKIYFQEVLWGRGAWTGLTWLRVGAGGGLLSMQ